MSGAVLKEAFEVRYKHGPFYTGGTIEWSMDGQYIFCQKDNTVAVMSVEKGVPLLFLGEPEESEAEDPICTFAISEDSANIITYHKSRVFKLWDWRDKKVLVLWKSFHVNPVICISYSSERNLMVSGGSDGSIRLWNLQNRTCTHTLKGAQGVISVLAFHPNVERNLVFAAGDDVKIHGWNCTSGKEEVTLSGHFSRVTSLSFLEEENCLVSSGRDRVLILWDISSQSSLRVLPVYEEIEGTFIIPRNTSLPIPLHNADEKSIHVAAAGVKGTVKVWEMRTGKQIYEQENSIVSTSSQPTALSITHLLFNRSRNSFALVTVHHNIIIHSLETFKHTKQLAGNSEEILDVAFLGEDGTHIVVATNSYDIKLYEISSMNCQLLCKHNDIVLSLATTPVNPYLLASSGKDNCVCVWLMDKQTGEVSCLMSATRHTAPVGCIAIAPTSSSFFASVSQDMCLKLWSLPSIDNFQDHGSFAANVSYTTVAHQKEINSVAISPNERLIATGSQDKTAKLWSADGLQSLGTLHGHRRGVWCVRFSPVDQVLLSTSADCTTKLWSLADLNCLKTLEGNDASVLKAEFLTRGRQIITAGGDGLLKLWDVKTSECVCTLEEHNSRVWALAVDGKEKNIVTGGTDSMLIIWRDVTEEKKLKASMELEQRVLEEQHLANLLQANELASALRLALKLERPHQVLRIVERIFMNDKVQLEPTIRNLEASHKEELLKCAVVWNTNSKNSHVAQVVISALMMEMENLALRSKLSSTLESLIPYTERHYARTTKLLQNLQLLSYTINCMKPHIESAEKTDRM